MQCYRFNIILSNCFRYGGRFGHGSLIPERVPSGNAMAGENCV